MSETTTEAVRPAPRVEIVGEHMLNAEAVLNVLPHAAKFEKDLGVRVIQHLVIEPDGTIAATNGRTIAAHRWAVTPAPNTRVLIELPDPDSSSMLKRLARKAIKESPLFGITLAPSGQTMVLTVGRESLTITPAYHADEFPNWRRLFATYRDSKSRTSPTPVIGLNVEYVKLFDGACQFTLGADTDAVIVRHNSNPNFWGAVMPYRMAQLLEPFPGWCAVDDYTPKPDEEGDQPGGIEITEPYRPDDGITATVSVNGGPEIDLRDEESVMNALAPVVEKAMGLPPSGEGE